MSAIWRTFTGAAAPLTLSSNITAGSMSIQLDGDASGWPTGADGRAFELVLNPGAADQETVLCSALTVGTPNTATVQFRGWDGSAAASHNSGIAVELVVSGDTIDDLSAHAYDGTRDDHPQYLNVARHDVTARHAFGPTSALGVPGTPASVGDTPSAGSGNAPAREDHVHDIGPAAVFADNLANGAVNDPRLFAAGIGPTIIAAAAPTTSVDGTRWFDTINRRWMTYDLANTRWVPDAGGMFMTATSTDASNITSGTPITVGSWAAGEDADGMFNTSTAPFKAPLAGRWRIRADVAFHNGVGGRRLQFSCSTAGLVNGQTLSGGASMFASIESEVAIRLVVNETVQVNVNQDTGSTIALSSPHQFSAEWIGV